MRHFWLSFLFLIILIPSLLATHQRAGEISYTYVTGLTYEFTIVTYTYTPSPADRPEIQVFWGDGTNSIIQRSSVVTMENDISKNTYTSQHTFPASGSYSVTFEDPNRNAGIVNIPNSVNIPFFIETIININPFLGGNSSPVLLNPPIDNGCTNVIYYHNPGAYDPDGDSLSYSLITCRGFEGEDIPGYTLPNASNAISIDAVSGDLVWDTPIMVGEYNIAILIKEWRNGILIGSMVRDMQISIAACNNQPPSIFAEDTCVLAGTFLRLNITSTDPNSTQITLSATGSPFEVSDSPASFPPITGASPLTGIFQWQTNCNHVKLNKYAVLLKALDNGPTVELASYKTIFIKVVAPRPENLTATPIANTIALNWNHSSCTNAIGYDIYKRNSSNPFIPDHCETGMPDDAGYVLIGSTNHLYDTTFIDNGSVTPLYHGNEYCYRVVAFFEDGAESYVSEEACAALLNDAPLITQVDVVETHSSDGIMHIQWCNPTEFDTIQFSDSQCEYRIYRSSSINTNPPEWIGTTYSFSDTSFTDSLLNTLELTYYYRIELWGHTPDSLLYVEQSDRASSVFIRLTPADREIELSWNEIVPWNNYQYSIYRFNRNLNQWDSIGTTNLSSYKDENLINGQEYCYYVQSKGAFYFPDTLSPLFNRSQKSCAIPIDNQPPEIPAITITTDCEVVTAEWSFSNDSASQDVYQYYIYYKPFYNADFKIIDSFYNDGYDCFYQPCHYIINSMDFITGCFAMAVIDTNHNLSDLTEITCFDAQDCMNYMLPNVFTPNGDGVNDFFRPFPYSNVKKIDLTIYNRWGRKVFSTENPDINWDGRDYLTKQPCSDGVYYYACDVIIMTLSGEDIFPLHGTITIITSK